MRIYAPFAFAFTATLFTGGCAFSPGQYIDRAALAETSSAENSMVELVPITQKLLSSQAASQPKVQIPQELLDYKPAPYRIGAGDVLQIIVWDHPELTTPAGQQQQPETNGRLVQPDGSVYFPYVGNTQVAGKTLVEVRELIAHRLKEWVEMPQVDVGVVRVISARVSLSGAFEKPNEQYISQTPLNLLAAVGSAGIRTAEADLTGLILKRDGKEFQLDLDALNRSASNLSSIYLKHGDHLHLPYNDRRKVYVMGEVARPASISFKTRSLSLSDALGMAGGIRQETADGDAIYVIRGLRAAEKKAVQVFQLEARSPVAMSLASRFEVQPQDVVFVSAANITRWNRFITQLLPSGQLVSSGASSVNSLENR